MKSVSIVGMGQTRVGELWDSSLIDLAVEAGISALAEAPTVKPQAVVIGNMMSGVLNGQEALSALVADRLGLHSVECLRVEAACASSAAAVRVGCSLIASGQFQSLLVIGAEKMTDRTPRENTDALTTASDSETERIHGATFPSLNALLMRLYLDKYKLPDDALAYFSITAHANGCHNPNAMFRRTISRDTYLQSEMVASPLRVLDAAPLCDGAAAVLIAERSFAIKEASKVVHILGSHSSNDRLALASRRDPLRLVAAEHSSVRALEQAGLSLEQIDLVEIHDAFSIMAALSMEALGFAKPGHGYKMAASVSEAKPYSTLGGLKARGHPVGASGLYQITDVCMQLRGEAGKAQVKGANRGLAQSFGGLAATVVTHVLAVD